MRIVDPRGEVRLGATSELQLAPRLSSMTEMSSIGFLVNERGDNMLTDFWRYSEILEELLLERFPIPVVLREAKPLLSRVAPDEILERLKSSTAVVNGIGK